MTYEELELENKLLKEELEKSRGDKLVAFNLSDNIGFYDIFSLSEIQKVQDLFAETTGVASIITHPNGEPITAPSNFSYLCSELIRKSQKGKRNCVKSDALIGSKVKDGAYYQPCLSCGLLDAAVAITVGGNHIATWLIGQIKNEKTNTSKILEYANEIGVDQAEFAKALDEVTSMSTEKFEKILETLHLFANEISEKAYKNIQQKYYIDELEKKEKLLIEEKIRAEESDTLKSEFINNLSHEIRTPMNGIIGFTDLMIEEGLTDEHMSNYVNIVQDCSRQLLRVIDDILEISQLDTQQVEVRHEEMYLNKLFLELYATYSRETQKKGIILKLRNGLQNNNSKIISDENLLYSIISNLLDNAVKYTQKGSIEFGYKVEDNTLKLYVKDTGVGILPEKQKLIFKRFTQEEKELSKNVGGLGLGLPIAKESIELLKGSISVESVKWQGSTFIVSLPYEPVDTKPNKVLSIDNSPSVTDVEQNAILIVEDEEVNYHLLKSFIISIFKIDCKLYYARNGVEAVNMCEKNEDIKMVFMDIKMPGMTGFEATKRIKQFRADLPIIAQTSYSTSSDKEKAMAFGFDDFLTKPISKDKLRELITEHYGA